ncbi:MAG: hypothetical protein ACJ739_06610 [Acidimicrobiales bacterium]
MRVLLASNSLVTLGGSETYLLTLGRHLQRYGHEVVVMEGPGNRGALAADAGLVWIDHPTRLDEAPDRILVQDAIVSGEAAAAWPSVPQLLVSHSTMHDHQLPGALPSTVGLIVVLNDLTAERARALAERRPVVRLTQPIDVGHFSPGPPPRPDPEVVLVFGNNQVLGRERLQEVCAQRGVELRYMGAVAGERRADPLVELREADIVIGYGRCILEAMACGRTAFVSDRFGTEGWVTADTYERLESSGFNGTAGLDEPGFDDWERMLDTYDPRLGAVGHDLVFRHHHPRDHGRRMIELLEGLGPPVPADPALSRSLARVWREQWRWESSAVTWAAERDRAQRARLELEEEVHRLRGELAAARGEVELARAEVAEMSADKLAFEASGSYRWAQRIARLRPGRRRDRS